VSRCFKAKNFPYSDILKASIGSSPSYVWRSIFNSLWVINKGSCWNIGDGNTIRIWEDNWIPQHNGFKPITTRRGISNVTKVKELLHQDGAGWNHQLIDTTFFPIDSHQIKQIHIINTSSEDSLMWMHENNGSYSVKSGYKAIQSWKTSSISNPSISSPDSHLWKKLWALHTIPRHKTILWRILNNSLPVKSELDKRGIHCIPLCPRCHTKVETLNHVFMSCPLITRTWFGSCLSLKIMEQPIHDVKDWIANIILTEKEDLIIQIASLTYNIWQARNQQVFEDLTIPEVDIIQRSERCINEFIQANSPSSSPDISPPYSDRHVLCPRPKRWIKPEAGWVKANSDANLQQPTKWGLGAIIRDEMGLVMVFAEWEMSGYQDA